MRAGPGLVPTFSCAHRLGDLNRLRSDELPLKFGRAVFEQHGDDLFEILAEPIEGGALRVRTGPAGDVANEQPRGVVALCGGGASIFL